MKFLNKSLLICMLNTILLNVAYGQKVIKHVFLIGVDGFGAYAMKNVKAPNLRKLMADGSWSMNARTVLPSSSAPNWASMVMGVGPELHGYTTWGSKAPDLIPRTVDNYGMFPSVYSLLREAKPKSEIGVIYEWTGIGYLFPKAAVNKDQHFNGDIAVKDAAVSYIKDKRPNFMFIHLHAPDSVGHAIGHASPEYYASIERTDKHVGDILKSIEDAGMSKHTIVIFTADHGGINKNHGAISMQEMQIPWIIHGPGVVKNKEIKQSIMTFDTAATIAYIFRLTPPQVWIGRNVAEAFSR